MTGNISWAQCKCNWSEWTPIQNIRKENKKTVNPASSLQVKIQRFEILNLFYIISISRNYFALQSKQIKMLANKYLQKKKEKREEFTNHFL